MIDALMRGIVRGVSAALYAVESEKPPAISRRGAMFVQRDLPDLAYLVNEGNCWQIGEASAVAAVIALPTTTAQLSLYNGEPDGGKSYVIIDVFGWQAANGAALNSWGIAHAIHDKPGTLPTADIAATSVRGLKARQGAYNGKMICDLAATVTDDLWKPLGPSAVTSVVSLSGTQIEVPVNGKIILPPGGMLSLAAVAAATGITTKLGVRWAELQLPS